MGTNSTVAEPAPGSAHADAAATTAITSAANAAPAMTSAQAAEEVWLDRRLFVAVSAILGLLVLLCVASLGVQVVTYLRAIGAASATNTSAILALNRALNAAILKTSALFLGYLLIFTGALYVLRIASASYQLTVKDGAQEGSLSTSSPGLVMLTLGVVLVVTALVTKSTIDYGQSNGTPGTTPFTNSSTQRFPETTQPQIDSGVQIPLASKPGGLGTP